jgi:hypothetical protein
MLTKEQIDKLFTFCEKHFVKYYEVQVELVDHLANAIEIKIADDHNLSFEKALEDVHQSFGLKGFAPLVSEKQIAAEKQVRKLFWKLFKDQLHWPKVLGFLVLTFAMITISSINVLIFKWLFKSIFFAGWIVEICSILQIHFLLSGTGKKFLLGKISEFFSWLLFPFYVIYFPLIPDKNFLPANLPVPSVLFYSILLSLFIIMIMVILQTISSAKKNLIQSFPEVFSVA